MMEECASLSMMRRMDRCVYAGWGLKSSSTNAGSNMAVTTSWSTLTAFSSGTDCARRRCSRMYSISTPRLHTTTGRHI